MPVETLSYATSQSTRRGHVRWWICGLLFLATTINYLDRQSLSMLKPLLEKELGWNEAQYGWMNFAFTGAYALGFTLAGRLVDVMGVRAGFALGVTIWSVALMGHSLAASTVGFAMARFFLGLGEATNFPACIKTVAQWFPQKERAFATGIFNSGSNVGIMLAPLVVTIATFWNWQAAFIVTGATGFIWLGLWLWSYHPPETHPSLQAAELAYIREGQENIQRVKLHWTAVLRHKQAWPFILGKFLTDPVWWFFLFWLPSYLKDVRGLSLTSSAWFLVIPYVAADIGSILGGWISGALMKRGFSVGSARYIAMGLCAICMPASIGAAFAGQFWLALAFISLATAGHQGWSANLFTTATDMFPPQVAGSVVGLGGTAGAIGGMLMTLTVGLILQWTNKYYLPVFIWAAFMHPLSLVLYWFIAGRDLTPADVSRAADRGLNRHLILGGSIGALVGAIGLTIGIAKWAYLVQVAKVAGAAGGITAAAGVLLVGLVIVYAGLPKPEAKTTG